MSLMSHHDQSQHTSQRRTPCERVGTRWSKLPLLVWPVRDWPRDVGLGRINPPVCDSEPIGGVQACADLDRSRDGEIRKA